jgi:hypothetical protein
LRRVRYLSSEWIDATARALAADDSLRTALADLSLTVEQVVTGGPDGTVRWHITVDRGDVTLRRGPAHDPDLSFTTNYDTAARVASGSLGAQRAFVEGRLRVGGDLSLLVTHQRAVASIDDALAEVRARTTYNNTRS